MYNLVRPVSLAERGGDEHRTVTDLGAAFGHWLRGLSVDGKRIRLYVMLGGGLALDLAVLGEE